MSSIYVVERIGLYVSCFTANQVMSVTRIVGLNIQENWKKIADMFNGPITWGIYCDELSLLKYSSGNDVASPPPGNEFESSAYFVRGLYRRYLRDSERNDYVSHPHTCTGHLLDTSCYCYFNFKALIYWNNIFFLCNSFLSFQLQYVPSLSGGDRSTLSPPLCVF